MNLFRSFNSFPQRLLNEHFFYALVATIRQRLTELARKLGQFVQNLNLFQSVPPSVNEHDLQNERISTRLFIVLLAFSLVIPTLYSSLIPLTQTDNIKTPTFEQYEQLILSYPKTLTCSCEFISINYEKFLHIEYTLHQVCSSMFVTQEWIDYLSRPFGNAPIYYLDFQFIGTYTFQALDAFCELVDQTINASLTQFYSNQYVSTTVTSSGLFRSQIQASIRQFKLSTTNNFLRSFDIIRSTTQSNGLFSGAQTNYRFELLSDGELVATILQNHASCFCQLSAKCISPHTIYHSDPSMRVFSIPDFYEGCYIVEALLQSTLECFYNQTCINQLQSYLEYYSPMTIAALNSSLPTNYSVNSTIKQLLDGLMVETWNELLKYKSYYNACQPTECIYTYETTNGAVYIITTIIGLVGGLITVLKVVVPLLVKSVRRKRRSATSENGKIFRKILMYYT